MANKKGTTQKSSNIQTKAIIAAVSVLVVVVVALLFLNQQGQTPAQQSAQGKDNLAYPSLSQIKAEMIDSISSVRTYQMQITGNMSLEIPQTTQSVKYRVTVNFADDLVSKDAYIGIDAVMSGLWGLRETQEAEVEMYIINGTEVYKKTSDSANGEIWLKAPMNSYTTQYDLPAVQYGPTSTKHLMKKMINATFQADWWRVAGVDTIGGEEAYRLEFVGDTKQILKDVMSQSLMSQISTDPSMGMAPGAVGVKVMLDVIDKMTIKANVTVWVRKSDYLPIKGSGTIYITLNLDQLYGTSGAGQVTATISIGATISYNQPVNIQLPEEAKGAIDVYSLYQTQLAGNTTTNTTV